MKWTSVKPDRPGFYFYRDGSGEGVDVWRVFVGLSDELYYEAVGAEGEWHMSEFHPSCEWSSEPIPEPGEVDCDGVKVAFRKSLEGWAPICPDCHGEGLIKHHRHTYLQGVYHLQTCPRGCKIPDDGEIKVGGTD